MSKKNNKNKSTKKSPATKAKVEPVVAPEPVVIPEPVIVPVMATPEKKKRGRKATILYVNYVDANGNLLPIGRPSKEVIRARLAVMLRKDQPYDRAAHFSLAIRLPEDDDRYLTFKGHSAAPAAPADPEQLAAPEPAYQDRVQSGELVAA